MTNNNNKVDEKTMTVPNDVDFCGLPTEDTQTTVESSANVKLATCKKLIVKFSRVNLKQVYGSKKDKIEPNSDFIALVPEFLESVYNAKYSDKSENEIPETLEEWKNHLLMSKVNVLFFQRAKSTALTLENADISKRIDEMESMADAGKVDDDELARLEAIIAKAKQAKESAKSA